MDKIDAYIWTLIAVAHAEAAMTEALTASYYLASCYTPQRNSFAQKALVAAGYAANTMKAAVEFFDEENYEAAVMAGAKAYGFLVQARTAAQNAAHDDDG